MGIQKKLATGRLMALLLAVAASACGGGGGGGTNPVPAPAPATPAAATNGGLLSFLPDNTIVTYQPASATALVTNSGVGGVAGAASGQGATITITESGGGATVVFNIPTTGATFTQQIGTSALDYYGGLSFGPLPNTAQFAAILSQVFGFPNTNGAVITQSVNCSSQTPCFYNYGANGGPLLPGPQMLNYAAYGLWASGDTATAGRAGTFAFGNLTPTASVPATGSATFNGTTIGVGGATSGSTVYALEGNAQIIANFATQSVTANLTNLSTQNISTNVVGSLPDLSGTSTISGNAYAGPITGTGLIGTINGNFYGPAAQETAGVWQASGGGNSWIGSYGAKLP
jgi:C-lobe and N-lobe beta barrels of Tf-binding protein B